MKGNENKPEIKDIIQLSPSSYELIKLLKLIQTAE
jgi:hypothetical protein